MVMRWRSCARLVEGREAGARGQHRRRVWRHGSRSRRWKVDQLMTIQDTPLTAPGNSQERLAATAIAEVTRGQRVESVHMGTVVVADAAGRIVASAGDPQTFSYFRSSAKPFQACLLYTSDAADDLL